MVEDTGRSAGALIGDLLHQIPELFRKELKLFRAEIDEKTTQIGVAIGLLASALVVALVALNVLAAALVAAIAELGIDGGWAALVVGVAFAVIAFAMAAKGVSDLKASNLAPSRTVGAVSKDAHMAKEKV